MRKREVRRSRGAELFLALALAVGPGHAAPAKAGEAPFTVREVRGEPQVRLSPTLAREVQRRFAAYRVPGAADEDPQLRALCVAACLTKPVRQSELYDALAQALSRHGPPAAPEPAQQPAAGPASLRPLRVLLAEDHPVNQRVAAHMIERLGHHVTIAGDGRQAVEACALADYDLVLMDLQMPVMDGFEALRALREGTSYGPGRDDSEGGD